MGKTVRLRVAFFPVCVLSLLTFACSNSSNNSSGAGNTSGMDMSGAWTLQAVSTQGQGSFSGTATVAQSGAGLGNAGTTTFTAAVGAIAISETGTALSGMLTNSIKGTNYNFIGTFSAGNLTITGSAPCSGAQGTQSSSMTGTITADSMQGSYTITRGSNCYYASDAGTWVATKQ